MSKLQTWQPFIKNSDGNAYPRAEMKAIDITRPGQGLEFEGAILNPLSLLLLDLALTVANKLVLTSDRVYLCACILPRDLFFARLSAHCAYRRVLSRNDYLIPNL